MKIDCFLGIDAEAVIMNGRILRETKSLRGELSRLHGADSSNTLVDVLWSDFC